MIVELFGPPAVGKTTCAYRLADALRARGHRVDLLMSLRPTEQPDDPPRRTLLPAAHRLLRPMRLLASDLRQAAGHREHVAATWHMLAAMPPRSPLWTVRLYRYLLHLHCAWETAAQAPGIVLVDQGFVQAIASLVLMSGCRNKARIDRELAAVPRPDLLISLHAPIMVLRERLAVRLPAQSRLERLLELSLEENLRFAGITADLATRLYRQGRDPVWLSSSADDQALEAVVARIEQIRAPRQQHSGTRRESRPSRAGIRIAS
jgi:predicted kinase